MHLPVASDIAAYALSIRLERAVANPCAAWISLQRASGDRNMTVARYEGHETGDRVVTGDARGYSGGVSPGRRAGPVCRGPGDE